ncbi:expressed unknown protein [Seminavis robusta]|uniref:Uncharacterized protein n=1 Tax=Seminavis robusta TaxID=568900 RepID=A0A9N8DI83_9STRA|nr:expressed unknown protein [Seminavis robusta]|eukprot:Sro77_g042150.1 n/a (525) ;mRNA; r:80681-82319
MATSASGDAFYDEDEGPAPYRYGSGEMIPVVVHAIAELEEEDNIPVVEAAVVTQLENDDIQPRYRDPLRRDNGTLHSTRAPQAELRPSMMDRVIPKSSEGKAFCLALAALVAFTLVASTGLFCSLGNCDVAGSGSPNADSAGEDAGNNFVSLSPSSATVSPSSAPTYWNQAENYTLSVDMSSLVISTSNFLLANHNNDNDTSTPMIEKLIESILEGLPIESSNPVALVPGSAEIAQEPLALAIQDCVVGIEDRNENNNTHCYFVRVHFQLFVTEAHKARYKRLCSQLGASLTLLTENNGHLIRSFVVKEESNLLFQDGRMDHCEPVNNDSITMTLTPSTAQPTATTNPLQQATPAPTPAPAPLRFDFHYTFFDDLVPLEKPTEAQLSALVCQTQVWVSERMNTNSTINSDTSLTMTAKDIGYQLGNNSFILFFRGEFSTGGEEESYFPTLEDVSSVLDATSKNSIMIIDSSELDYVLDHVYASSPLDGSLNYFRDVNGTTYHVDYDDEADGAQSSVMEEAHCHP